MQDKQIIRQKCVSGNSLVSTIIMVSIICILTTLLMPNVVQSHKTSLHKSAIETTFHTMNFAKSVATTTEKEITVSFHSNALWCIGFSDLGKCDCNKANSCTINSNERTISYRDFPDIFLTDISFKDDHYTVIRSNHQYSDVDYDTGFFILEEGDNRVKLEKKLLDRIKICTLQGSVSGYSSC